MRDEIISFKTAQLAKEKGCNLNIYGSQNEMLVLTQSLLQRWLREEHDINISIWHNNLTNKYRPESSFDSLDDILDNYNEFKTYEEALEEGLYQALLLIKT